MFSGYIVGAGSPYFVTGPKDASGITQSSEGTWDEDLASQSTLNDGSSWEGLEAYPSTSRSNTTGKYNESSSTEIP